VCSSDLLDVHRAAPERSRVPAPRCYARCRRRAEIVLSHCSTPRPSSDKVTRPPRRRSLASTHLPPWRRVPSLPGADARASGSFHEGFVASIRMFHRTGFHRCPDADAGVASRRAFVVRLLRTDVHRLRTLRSRRRRLLVVGDTETPSRATCVPAIDPLRSACRPDDTLAAGHEIPRHGHASNATNPAASTYESSYVSRLVTTRRASRNDGFAPSHLGVRRPRS